MICCRRQINRRRKKKKTPPKPEKSGEANKEKKLINIAFLQTSTLNNSSLFIEESQNLITLFYRFSLRDNASNFSILPPYLTVYVCYI